VKSRDVRDGQNQSVSREPEVIRAFRDTWKDEIHSYLGYLRDRLFAARDLLHPSGSIFVQIGDENLHIVRALLDEVIGASNSVAVITIQKAGSTFSQYLGSVADFVLWYAADISRLKYRQVFRDREITDEESGRFTGVQLADGRRVPRSKIGKLPSDALLFAPDPLESAGMGREKGEGAASWFRVQINGREFSPSGQTRWKTNEIRSHCSTSTDASLPVGRRAASDLRRLSVALRSHPAGNR
jgi:adenine-specific DNA-methyltransferase